MYPALDILASVLGSDKGSRLVGRLEDERQLAIHIDAFSYTPYFQGIFGVSATTTPDKVESLKTAIFDEIKKISGDDKVNKDELKRIVNQISTSYSRTLRSNGNVARMIGNSVLSYGTPEYVNKYLENVEKLTVDDVTRVARKYLTAENCTVVELLPKGEKDGSETIDRQKKTELSRPEFMKLESGQKIITLQDAKLPLVDVCIVLTGGVIRENKENAGITRILSSMLTAGTDSYDFSTAVPMIHNGVFVDPQPYTGPATGAGGATILFEFLGDGTNEVLQGTDYSDFINLGAGDDAVNGGGGNDVIDGGLGSNFLTGGPGTDIFFIDGRGGGITWSTITDWEEGEQLSVWGWTPGTSRIVLWQWDGVEGYKGLTMHADLNNDGTIDTSVTFTGITSQSQLPVPLEFPNLLWFQS